MGKPETDLAPRIRDKTLELLREKEPEAISMRDIARACGVTATSLYYYYRDRETLFTEIKFHCIKKMNAFIAAQAVKKAAKHRRAGKETNPLTEVRAGLEACRDWAFANPRMALLVMGRFRADTRADPEKMEKYYQSHVAAQTMLNKAVQAGFLHSRDTLLDASLAIAALGGAVESVLLNRTIPRYWSKRGEIEFTNKMIDLILQGVKYV